jgi:hypothetical protein
MNDAFLISPCNSDLERMQDIEDSILCNKCGLPAPIMQSNSCTWTDKQGYAKHRIRIVSKCRNCGNRSIFRLGGYVINNFEHVKAK